MAYTVGLHCSQTARSSKSRLTPVLERDIISSSKVTANARLKDRLDKKKKVQALLYWQIHQEHAGMVKAVADGLSKQLLHVLHQICLDVYTLLTPNFLPFFGGEKGAGKGKKVAFPDKLSCLVCVYIQALTMTRMKKKI